VPSDPEWWAFFENNPIMYFLVGVGGTILSVNEYGAAELGYRVDELVGQSVFKVFPDAERERVRANLDLCLESVGPANTWEAQKIRKDGAALWVRENAKAIRRSNGELAVLMACEDITERGVRKKRLATAQGVSARSSTMPTM
jgi:PAS domain S-box-containing protein